MAELVEGITISTGIIITTIEVECNSSSNNKALEVPETRARTIVADPAVIIITIIMADMRTIGGMGQRGGGGPNNGGGQGRFNNHYNNNNNNINHRKPQTNTAGGATGDGNRSTGNNHQNNADEKSHSQSQSPFPGNAGNTNNTPRHGQSPGPAANTGKGHYNDGATVNASGQYGNQQQQQSIPGQQEESGNNQLLYGIPEGVGAVHQLQSTVPMNYFGSAGQQFAFSGPPPHLPPPFGGSAVGAGAQLMTNNPQQQQMMGIAPITSLSQQAPAPQMYNSPFYTYATYYPVDMMGQGGLISAGGDVNGSNMIIQSMPYMTATAPGSPYQNVSTNQHLMGASGNAQQVRKLFNFLLRDWIKVAFDLLCLFSLLDFRIFTDDSVLYLSIRSRLHRIQECTTPLQENLARR